MNDQQQHPPSKINIPWSACVGFATASTPLRYGEGTEGVAMPAFWASIVMICYAMLVPCPPLLGYWMLFMALTMVKLCFAYFNTAEMSDFGGKPIACLIGVPNIIARQFIEPLMAYWLGQYLAHYNHPLGLFFLIGSACTFIRTVLERAALRARRIARRNIEIQMRIDAQNRGW